MREYEQRAWAERKADIDLFNEAAARIRLNTRDDQEAGVLNPSVGFAIAIVFDTLALQVDVLPSDLRSQAVYSAKVILDRPLTRQAARARAMRARGKNDQSQSDGPGLR